MDRLNLWYQIMLLYATAQFYERVQKVRIFLLLLNVKQDSKNDFL